eukprot:4127307-Amphidinium_carterae.1
MQRCTTPKQAVQLSARSSTWVHHVINMSGLRLACRSRQPWPHAVSFLSVQEQSGQLVCPEGPRVHHVDNLYSIVPAEMVVEALLNHQQ